MQGTHLRFYTYENRRVHGALTYEWLLEQAKKLGIHGGSAFRAIAGYGQHGQLHEQHFFELAGEQPVLVEFIVDAAQAQALFALLEHENVVLFYACMPTDYGITGSANGEGGAPS